MGPDMFLLLYRVGPDCICRLLSVMIFMFVSVFVFVMVLNHDSTCVCESWFVYFGLFK